jgi:hypothetical protein
MLSGINSDVEYKGALYHVQTEEGGAASPVITTLLFRGGAICSIKKISYKDALKSPSLNQIVRDMMNEQHKAMLKELASGRFDPSPDKPPPSKKGVCEKKNLDEMIVDYLSQKYSHG